MTILGLVLISLINSPSASAVMGSISTPAANQVLDNKLIVATNASKRITYTLFYIDGNRVGIDKNYPFRLSGDKGYYDISKLPNGEHTLKVDFFYFKKTLKSLNSNSSTESRKRSSKKIKSFRRIKVKVTAERTFVIKHKIVVAPPTTPSEPTPNPVAPEIPVPSPNKPYGQTGNWNLIFSDDFNGSSLDTTKWSNQRSDWITGGSPYNNLENAWYLPGNTTVANGSVATTIKHQSSNGYSYTTGSFNSNKKFSYKYGYVEARIFIPSCTGCWPAFWMLPSINGWPPEIDIFEFFSTDIDKRPWAAYHWPSTAQGGQEYTNCPYGVTGADYTNSWHVYGMTWTANKIQMFVDGIPSCSWTDTSKLPNENMYLILQLASGLGYNPPNNVSMLTDYVRVWKPTA